MLVFAIVLSCGIYGYVVVSRVFCCGCRGRIFSCGISDGIVFRSVIYTRFIVTPYRALPVSLFIFMDVFYLYTIPY